MLLTHAPVAALIRSADYFLEQQPMPGQVELAGPPQYNGLVRTRRGYALFFTVRFTDGLPAVRVKVCENRVAQVTGASNVSDGQPSCA